MQQDIGGRSNYFLNLFHFIATENEEMVDVTELKHYLHRVNMHRSNPSLFKRLADIAKKSDFTAKWSLEQMVDFFTNSSF